MMTSRDMDGVEGDDDRVDGGLGYGYIASEESAPISVWLAQSKCVDMLPSTLASSPSTECVLALLVDLSDPLDVGDALERHAAAAAKFKGATTVVVGCRSESVKTWEVDPDMVQVRLRKYCLGAGAGLVYLSTSLVKTLAVSRLRCLPGVFSRRGAMKTAMAPTIMQKSRRLAAHLSSSDPDSLFIPAGWDDAGRIKALEHDVGDKEWPARPKDAAGAARETPEMVQADDDQTFLARLATKQRSCRRRPPAAVCIRANKCAKIEARSCSLTNNHPSRPEVHRDLQGPLLELLYQRQRLQPRLLLRLVPKRIPR